MAHTLDKEKFPDNPRPIGQQMTLDAGVTRWISTPSGITARPSSTSTRCALFLEGKLYNGIRRRKRSAMRVAACSIEESEEGVITRGVAGRSAAPEKREYLEPGTPFIPPT